MSGRPWAILALIAVASIQTGCATRQVRVHEAVHSSPADTLAFFSLGTDADELQIRRAICGVLQERRDSYSTSIQPEAVTDDRLRAAGRGLSLGCPLWCDRSGLVETDSSAYLSGVSGARFVMIGYVSSYGVASFGSFLISLLFLGMVPPSADQPEVQLDLALYDGQSRKRVWTYHHEGFRKALSNPDALKRTVGEPLARSLPFARK